MKRVHGRPLHVYVGSKSESTKTVIDHETLFKIKTETNVSGKKICKIAKILKDSTAQIKLEPYFKDALIEKNRSVEEFFDVQEMEMLVKEPKQDCFTKVKKEWVYCNDIESYVTHIAQERGYEDTDLQVEVNFDAGQGFLKVNLSVKELGDGSFGQPPVKKPKYKDSGVKKTHIIGNINLLHVLVL